MQVPSMSLSSGCPTKNTSSRDGPATPSSRYHGTRFCVCQSHAAELCTALCGISPLRAYIHPLLFAPRHSILRQDVVTGPSMFPLTLLGEVTGLSTKSRVELSDDCILCHHSLCFACLCLLPTPRHNLIPQRSIIHLGTVCCCHLETWTP